MRRARIFLFLFLVVLAAAVYIGFQTGWELPVPGQDETTPGSRDSQRSAKEEALRPTFDVVRAEPTGELVMAGRAEPGWTVTVEGNGKVLGSSVVDNNGEWIIQPTSPIAKGEHSLQLKSRSPKGEHSLFSAQRLALSLGGDPTKRQPLVALTEEGEPTRVLQMSPPVSDEKRLASANPAATTNIETPPFRPTPQSSEQTAAQVSFTSVDFEETNGRNTVFLSGRGTPGSRLMLYLDNEFAGTSMVDATGSWTFKAVRDLPPGTHALRADSVEMADGKVLARAEVNFDRQGNEVASLEPPTASAGQPAQVARDVSPVARTPIPASAANGVKPDSETPAPVKVADTSPDETAEPTDGGVIVVRKGDTLWHIARQQYGNGRKFTEIFQNNRGQIRNPNLIYPSQRFAIPH